MSTPRMRHYLQPRDVVTISIYGIGQLTSPIAAG
jgi:hypothetical protein